MTVPPECLVPPDARSCGLGARQAAVVLDGGLRRLAGQEARCRLVLGRLAAVLLRRRDVVPLGFVRVDDWARERLGLSGREVQSMACVVGRLARLPRLVAAFERGVLSWAQVRLLAPIATPDTEAAWLARARGRTTRALEALIRAAGRIPDTGEADEPVLRFRLGCSRRVRRLWRDTVTLARQVAGAELTTAQAAEAIAAEGLSARPARHDAWPGPPASADVAADPDEAPLVHLDWRAVREALPARVETLAEGAERLDAFELDERMQVAARAMQQVDWQTGRLLRMLLDRRLYRTLGFPSAARYLRERLGMSSRKAAALVAIERRTRRVPALGEAYRAGRISAVRALTLLPLLRPDTAVAWVARAREVTVRRLADEVEWALAAGEPLPPPRDAVLDTDDVQMRARAGREPHDAEIRFTGPASVVALFRTAIVTFAARGDSLADGLARLLHHARDTWRGLPRHHDPVFARDGWRCAVPACTARRGLHDHHVLFRSRGGGNQRGNRITVCAAHHLRGIHAGYVRAVGEAPHAITWELGVRPGRPPLLRLVGDVYAA